MRRTPSKTESKRENLSIRLITSGRFHPSRPWRRRQRRWIPSSSKTKSKLFRICKNRHHRRLPIRRKHSNRRSFPIFRQSNGHHLRKQTTGPNAFHRPELIRPQASRKKKNSNRAMIRNSLDCGCCRKVLNTSSRPRPRKSKNPSSGPFRRLPESARTCGRRWMAFVIRWMSSALPLCLSKTKRASLRQRRRRSHQHPHADASRNSTSAPNWPNCNASTKRSRKSSAISVSQCGIASGSQSGGKLIINHLIFPCDSELKRKEKEKKSEKRKSKKKQQQHQQQQQRQELELKQQQSGADERPMSDNGRLATPPKCTGDLMSPSRLDHLPLHPRNLIRWITNPHLVNDPSPSFVRDWSIPGYWLND